MEQNANKIVLALHKITISRHMEQLNNLLFSAINQFAGQSQFFDHLLIFLAEAMPYAFIILVVILWFRSNEEIKRYLISATLTSVVGITTSGTTTNVFGQISKFASSGTGFVIKEDGYIVTNHHVISGAMSVSVTFLDGTTYDAEIVGSDPSNDVALLKVDAKGLQAVTIGNSDQLEVGEQVAAIGNPLGELTYTQTVGYISAMDRAINTDGTPIDMMQTDVAINSGNSGGPLFDMYGNVIGVTTAKYSGNSMSGASIEGIGFAIPINDVIQIVGDIQEHGYVTGQAALGVTVKSMDSATAEYYGLPVGIRVETVIEGSCAETAGMMVGDIIIAIGDVATEDYSDLATELQNLKAGDETTVDVYRAGKTMSLEITLDEKIPTPPSAEVPQPETFDKETESGLLPFEEFFGG